MECLVMCSRRCLLHTQKISFKIKNNHRATDGVWHYQALENLNAVCAFKWVLSHNNKKKQEKDIQRGNLGFFHMETLQKKFKNSMAPLNCKLNACMSWVYVCEREQ